MPIKAIFNDYFLFCRQNFTATVSVIIMDLFLIFPFLRAKYFVLRGAPDPTF